MPTFPTVFRHLCETWEKSFPRIGVSQLAWPFKDSTRAPAGVVHQLQAAPGAGLARDDVTAERRARSCGGGFKRRGRRRPRAGGSCGSAGLRSLCPRTVASVRRREDLAGRAGRCLRRSMAVAATIAQRKRIKRKAPRGFLRRVFKRRKPHLRLEARCDLLVSSLPGGLGAGPGPGPGGGAGSPQPPFAPRTSPSSRPVCWARPART